MKRRQFLHTSKAISLLPLLDYVDLFSFPNNWEEMLKVFLLANDERVQGILEKQETREAHPFFGGWPDRYEIYHPGHVTSYTKILVASYVSAQSEYYQSRKIEASLDMGMDFLLRSQHADGNIDLLTTNFHSPPDTGFASEAVGQALQILRKHAPNSLKKFQQQARSFLEAAGQAMVVGGIHTPNHRWVVCAALSRIHSMFPNPAYTKRVEQWLAEGIDLDPDGQYTEKSTVVYSPITNNALITIARHLGKEELYDPVRKNLRMTQFMVHANGEVVTEVSTRQDQFTIANMSRYYYSYRFMALREQDRIFSAMAQQIEQSVGMKALSGHLFSFLEDESLQKELPERATLSSTYTRHFPSSLLARIRRGDIDISVLGNNSIFCTFFKGKAALQGIRMASAFFGKGQFVSPTLRVENGRYILEQELRGPYYQPHQQEQIAKDGDWHKMPRKLRKQSEVQYMMSRVEIFEEAGKFKVAFSVTGTDHVPVAIELAFRKGGKFAGVEKAPASDSSFLLKEEKGSYSFEGDTITFGPRLRAHAYTQIRGAKDKLNGDCVYITGYTPFAYSLELG